MLNIFSSYSNRTQEELSHSMNLFELLIFLSQKRSFWLIVTPLNVVSLTKTLVVFSVKTF